MERILLAGLIRIDLPGRAPVLLCDGGFVPWGADTYLSADPAFGTLAGFEAPEEGVDDTLPAGTLQMLPAGTAAVVDLSRPEYQGSRVRMWIAELDEVSGQIAAAPDIQADWQVDRTVYRSKRGERSLDIDCVSSAQRLLIKVEGNTLSSAFHSSIFPGERGHDNATGLETNFAWGAVATPRGTSASNVGA
jgi:hypothetical protein